MACKKDTPSQPETKEGQSENWQSIGALAAKLVRDAAKGKAA